MNGGDRIRAARSLPAALIVTTVVALAALPVAPLSAVDRPQAESRDADVPDGRVRNAFLPGIAAGAVQPFEEPKLYVGLDFHYSFLQGVSEPASTEEFGGYYESYAEIGFYKEYGSAFNDDIFFTYAAGVNLSFEKFYGYHRSFLIPYFGAKVGGIFINARGGGFLLEPVLGIVALLTPWFNLNYGASLFLNTVDLAAFIGLHHALVINFNL